MDAKRIYNPDTAISGEQIEPSGHSSVKSTRDQKRPRGFYTSKHKMSQIQKLSQNNTSRRVENNNMPSTNKIMNPMQPNASQGVMNFTNEEPLIVPSTAANANYNLNSTSNLPSNAAQNQQIPP